MPLKQKQKSLNRLQQRNKDCILIKKPVFAGFFLTWNQPRHRAKKRISSAHDHSLDALGYAW